MAKEATFLAKHEVHICTAPGKPATDKTPAVPPKVSIVPAGGKLVIDPDSDTALELKQAGAIVPFKDAEDAGVTKIVAEKAPAKKAPAKKAPAKKPAAAEGSSDAGDGGGDAGDAGDAGNDEDDGGDMV